MQSPTIILRERDASSYAITSSDTALAVVGYATKGPIRKLTRVTSRGEFIEMFGVPPKTAPWGHLAVYRAFNQGNQIYFYRVADETAAGAELVIRNMSDGTVAYQEFVRTTSISSGNYIPKEIYEFKLNIDGAGAKNIYIVSPASGDWSLSSIASAANIQITGNTFAFQEFSATESVVIPANAEYRFKIDLDGTGLGSEKEFSIFPGNGTVSLSTISTHIETSLSGGTNGYQRIDLEEVVTPGNDVGLTDEATFKLKVDGVDKDIVTGVDTTWTELIGIIQTAVGAENYTVWLDQEATSFIRIQSTVRGAASTVTVADGDSDGLLAALTALLTGSATPVAAVDGADGLTPTGNYSVSVHSGTGRIRISSLNGTTLDPELTEVDVKASSVGGTTRSLITLLTSILPMRKGSSSLEASAAVNSTTSKIRISTDEEGAAKSVSITAGDTSGTQNLITALGGTETAVAGTDPVLPEESDNILFKAKETGSETNNISIVKSSRLHPISGATLHRMEVYYKDNLKETFDEVSMSIDDDDFFATVINKAVENGGSAWISVEYEDNDADDVITVEDGTYTLGEEVGEEYSPGDEIEDYDYKMGTDGIPVGDGSALFVAAMDSDGDLGNNEVFDFHILITPDNGSQATQNACISLAESRKDFIYLADPPFGLTYRQAAEWHNGTGSHGRETALNSSYAATYWPWLQDYDSYNKQYVWCPPSVFITEKYMEVDRTYGPWAAAAGDTRGRLVANDIETSPSKNHRDYLYGELNAVNPISNFFTKGVIVYGQKTLLRERSSLNRVNVRRMVIYVKKLIKRAMEGMLFEANSPESWGRATNFINNILENVRKRGGIDQYIVTINNTTTTQDLMAQNIMKGVIQIVPVGAIEFVDIDIVINSPGVTLS